MTKYNIKVLLERTKKSIDNLDYNIVRLIDANVLSLNEGNRIREHLHKLRSKIVKGWLG